MGSISLSVPILLAATLSGAGGRLMDSVRTLGIGDIRNAECDV